MRSDDASKRTLRRRSHEIEEHRNTASGGSDTVQLQSEIKRLTSHDRQKLLADINFKIEVPADVGLSLKTELCLPWNRMRTMRRYNQYSI